MKRNRKAKILATLGPASSSSETIERVFEAGCDVFRLNFSHGSVETHRQNLEWIRQLEEKYNHATCILADLQGPKEPFTKSSTRSSYLALDNLTFKCFGPD